jgi:hypothetical protein
MLLKAAGGKQVLIQPGLQAFEQALLAFSPNISIYRIELSQYHFPLRIVSLSLADFNTNVLHPRARRF